MKNVIINRWCLGANFVAINLFGIVFSNRKLTPILANHEYIHTIQQREMLYIFFYIWYLTEWMIKLIYYRDLMKAYEAISFEREAYANQVNMDYIRQRRHYIWRKFIVLKKR